MDLGLKGKVALVTASSQGLGFAVARELATEGCSIIICSRGGERLEAAREELEQKAPGRVLAVTADLEDSDAIARLVSASRKAFGTIDILVNNSGGPRAGTFETLRQDDWEKAARGLLLSVVELTRLVVPDMKKRSWGRILNVTSIAAKQPVNNLILSNSLRAGLTGFAKSLANEVAPFGITVNSILPGYTETERVRELAAALALREGTDEAEVTSRWESEIPMGRLGSPSEFAAVAAFLVSERAGYITGASIPVDGGWIRSIF